MDNPIGVVSCHLEFAFLAEAFEQAAAFGVGVIEWYEGLETPLTGPGGSAERILRLSAEYGMRTAYHAPWQGHWNLGLLEPAEAAATLADILHRAARLAATHVTLHAGGAKSAEEAQRSPHADEAACLDCVIDAISANLPLAEDADLILGVENQPAGPCSGVEDFDRLFARIDSPRVGLHLDIGHANIAGTLKPLLAKHAARLVGTHVHDNDGAHDTHRPPGEGTVDWPALLASLAATGYTGPLTFEFPAASGAYPAFIRRIREFDTADTTVRSDSVPREDNGT